MLESILHPRQLRQLSLDQLEELAQEIRETIVKTVSKNGGHLASSLGVVELSLALTVLLDWEKDKIVWDVGHQAYPHKLLTGRFERFDSLRQYGGISGFLRPSESRFDHFAAGHASTSISAALGMALARDCRGEKKNVVAVIGDGALTGGMALEGLNHAGHLDTDLLVVLNDNDLSIAPNVGAWGAYLNRLRTHPAYHSLKREAANHLQGVLGGRIYRGMDRFKAAIKFATLIGGRTGGVFEELGFTYIGPIDGHDLRKLIPMLELALAAKGPVLAHVSTVKGKGYLPAEKKPSFFHGVGPFDPLTGEVLKKSVDPEKKSFTEIFGKALVSCAGKNEKIVAITAAMPDGTGLSNFAEKFPDRYFDVGICEEHAVTLAAGLAASGLVPVVAIYSTFLQRGFDQIIHDVCLQGLPVVFAIDRAGLVGEDGPTHHGVFDLAYLKMIPGLTVLAPADGEDLEEMLAAAIAYGAPVAIRYPRGFAEREEDPERGDFRIGQAQVRRRGKDLVLCAVGTMLQKALQAAELLAKENIFASVVNVRTVQPFDEELLLSLAKSHRAVITIEEGNPGGFGSALLEKLAENNILVPFRSITLPPRFIEHGPVEKLREVYGLTPEAIAICAEILLQRANV
jgi:1-deoxy-D-xylulose-5-phosphate synthase